jgi:hypothetical protein
MISGAALRWIPFGNLVVTSEGRAMWKHPLIVRLAEAAIIGAVVMWGVVERTQIHVEGLREDVARIERMVEGVRSDMRALERDVFPRRLPPGPDRMAAR